MPTVTNYKYILTIIHLVQVAEVVVGRVSPKGPAAAAMVLILQQCQRHRCRMPRLATLSLLLSQVFSAPIMAR